MMMMLRREVRNELLDDRRGYEEGFIRWVLTNHCEPHNDGSDVMLKCLRGTSEYFSIFEFMIPTDCDAVTKGSR